MLVALHVTTMRALSVTGAADSLAPSSESAKTEGHCVPHWTDLLGRARLHEIPAGDALCHSCDGRGVHSSRLGGRATTPVSYSSRFQTAREKSGKQRGDTAATHLATLWASESFFIALILGEAMPEGRPRRRWRRPGRAACEDSSRRTTTLWRKRRRGRAARARRLHGPGAGENPAVLRGRPVCSLNFGSRRKKIKEAEKKSGKRSMRQHRRPSDLREREGGELRRKSALPARDSLREEGGAGALPKIRQNGASFLSPAAWS